MLLVCFTLLIVWSAIFVEPGWFELFSGHIVIVVMMIVGSFVAGSTPLGGGSVAFPVMTKLLSTSFTIFFRLNIILSTQASVIIMAITSILGVLILFSQGAQPSEVIFEYWYVAAPVVIFGAPIGAWVCFKASKKVVHHMIIALASLELASTLLLLPLGKKSIWIFCLQLLVMFALFSLNMKQIRRLG
ncbi:hypothetical protein [Vibrio aquimaris]|uniref:Membrane transporter protein n=1 Tax=Vibrio aquimaris TaxID=2587862 RepID=A0A5P9CMX0_9VIBR|nr:hypothetical protein [Vibrio aquimaris]QFT27303.1 hypothetical protein FIV01_12835 [Vibrio aquimaris]